MKFFSTLSKEISHEAILADLLEGASEGYDLAIMFFSARPAKDVQEMADAIKVRCGVKHFIACSASGVIGRDQEVETAPSTSLLLARLPGAHIKPFYLDQPRLLALEQTSDWQDLFSVEPNATPTFLAFADPFRFDINRFVTGVNAAYPGRPLVGGLCSASAEAGGNLLFVDGETFTEGVVGLMFTGNIRIEILLSQGCRPVGEHFIITAAQRNVIQALAGRPFLDVVRTVFEDASEEDRKLIQQALFVGLAIDEYKFPYERGDFLIRGVLGIDQETGAGVIGDVVRTGQTVQLQVRDARTAEEDLKAILHRYKQNVKGPHPAGALLFSCNGRGRELFEQPHHDVKLIQKSLGVLPITGFFCAGELGPVGGQNYIHGFTDSLVLFHPVFDGVEENTTKGA